MSRREDTVESTALLLSLSCEISEIYSLYINRFPKKCGYRGCTPMLVHVDETPHLKSTLVLNYPDMWEKGELLFYRNQSCNFWFVELNLITEIICCLLQNSIHLFFEHRVIEHFLDAMNYSQYKTKIDSFLISNL